MSAKRKLGRILSGAALAVAGGTALGVALTQEAQDEGLTDCAQWRKLVQRATTGRDDESWFVLVEDGYRPPEAVGDQVVGTVDGDDLFGRLHATPSVCEAGTEYDYKRSAALNGWRLYLLDGDRYFARSWRDLAQSANEVRFWGGWADIVGNCLAVTTGANCRDLLTQVTDCWRLGNGNLCRHGLEYGPGVGGVLPDGSPATCSPDAQSVPYPCSDRGRGRRWAERAVSQSLDVGRE